MDLPLLIEISAAICLIPALIHGTISDLKTRTFPKTYWKPYFEIAGVFTILSYLVLLAKGDLFLIGVQLAISIISTIIFSFMGFRFGSGGDWRAFIIIAWVAPELIVTTVLFSLLYGSIQSVYSLIKHGEDPPYCVHVAYTLAILSGLITAIGYALITTI